MAEKKYLDQNGLLYVWQKLKPMFANKVDKQEGMTLTHNDLTDELLEQLQKAGSYTDLEGKPQIGGHELASGDNTLEDLGIQAAGDYATNSDMTAKLAKKVDAVDGKGLSTKDFTEEYETKLNGIAEGAEENKIEIINVNGKAAVISPEDKSVDLTIPKALSELTNDGNFVTDAAYQHTDNNFSNEYKTKVDNLSTEIEKDVNKIEIIKVNGKVQAISEEDKSVDLKVPEKVSDIENDSGFQTLANVNSVIATATANMATQSDIEDMATKTWTSGQITTATSDMATQTWVNGQIANLNKKQVVTSTKEMTNESVIYLMSNSGSGNNVYDEYIVIEGTPEKIGSTEVDLTPYQRSDELKAITNTEIDSIFTE